MHPGARVRWEGVTVSELGQEPREGVVAGGDVGEGGFVGGAEGGEEGVVGKRGGVRG